MDFGQAIKAMKAGSKVSRSGWNVLLSAENATHLLGCRQCIGRSSRIYYMRCHVLKNMSNGRIKVLVFGERNWKNRDHISRIRYVDSYRIIGR